MGTQPFVLERFKAQLKLAIGRLVHLQKKLTAQGIAARAEISELLRAGKGDQAMTKVRYIVRDDFLVEAMEFVQSFCDDLLKSSNLIANNKECDEFITEQAKSVIYASDRLDVPELKTIKDLLVAKYGKSIVPEREVGVYPNLVVKLSMSNPDRNICEKYLEAIADNAGIELHPSSSSDETSSVDGEVVPALAEKPKATSASASSSAQAPTITASSSTLPPPGNSSKPKPAAKPSNGVPDFDELTRRFEELRSRK